MRSMSMCDSIVKTPSDPVITLSLATILPIDHAAELNLANGAGIHTTRTIALPCARRCEIGYPPLHPSETQ